ncbi:MAG: CooT family nickel-binding protein [Chloroflexota bacterium]
MCLSRAYLETNGKSELLMAEITRVEIAGDRLILKDLFGQQKEIGGRLKVVDFVANTMLVEKVL